MLQALNTMRFNTIFGTQTCRLRRGNQLNILLPC
jgi:hypothetical protein